MEQKKENKEPIKKEEKVKKELTPQAMQKRKKLIIFPLMILAFIVSLWFIFAPSSKKEERGDKLGGFNAELPLPNQNEIISDKKKAYEQEQLKRNREERMRTLEDFGFSNEKEDNFSETDDALIADYNQREQPNRESSGNSSIQSSANRYREINQQLDNFYEEPTYDISKDELFDRITELEMRIRESESTQSSTDDQLQILEKSYELAAKYINNGQAGNDITTSIPAREATSNHQKTKVLSVKSVDENIVSRLQQPISDSLFLLEYSQPRNSTFNTPTQSIQSVHKNTILASIHENQTVMDGQNVRLRLLEPLQADQIVIPKNTLITGIASIQQERLDIKIVSIAYNGIILSVDLSVYDTDGQKGLASPNTLEMQSLTEGAANIGSGLGSSFTVNRGAGSAIVSDLTRGVLQGGSQYLSKKLRTAKVSLKADYQVMLLSK